MSRPFLIVTCDGGGLRGTLPSMVLRALGDDLVRRADMFTGTSTGSFIATMLASGRSVDEVADFYMAPQICRTLYTAYAPDETPAQKAVYPLYSSAGKRTALKPYLPQGPLSSVPKPLLLTTTRLRAQEDGVKRWAPAAMHNLSIELWSQYRDVELLDAVMASGAMPPAFAPQEVKGELFSDGALCANNPVVLALSAALGAGLVGPRGVVPLPDVYVLSLGTGFVPASMPPGEAIEPFETCPWGALGWFYPKATDTTPPLPMLGVLSDSTVELATLQAQLILGNANFRRVTWDLSAAGDPPLGTRDCSQIPRFEELAQTYLESPAFADLQGWLAGI